MAASRNKSWNLEAFLDSFIHELDKARDTLAIKGVNKPLTYAVKDLSMDLQLFPEYDGKQVRFVTAKPGEEGSSKVSIQLGSITDRQIRETSKQPMSNDDLSIDEIEGIEEEDRDSLRKMGVLSVSDLEQLEHKNIAVEEVARKMGKSNYSGLADRLRKAREIKNSYVKQKSLSQDRELMKPSITGVSLAKMSDSKIALRVEGENLLLDKSFTPVAELNGVPVEVVASGADKLIIAINNDLLKNHESKEIKVILDPFSIVKFKIK